MSFIVGSLSGSKLFLQSGDFGLGLGYHTAQQFLGKGTLAPQNLDDFCFQHIQVCDGFYVFSPDGLEQLLPLLHFFTISGIDDFALGNRLHPFKYLPNYLVDDTVQNVGGVAGLPIALCLLAGLAVADIADTLHDPVWVCGAGIGFPVGCKGQPRPAVTAEHVARQEGLPTNVPRNSALLLYSVGAGGADTLSGIKHLLRD